MNVVSYGGGTNSTAMLVGMHERGEMPDIILFADTGGERPETYRHIGAVDGWCESVGFPTITVVRETKTLEQDCLDRNALPGIAYGFKSCSERWKIRPQKRWLKQNGLKDVQFLVGIDAGEKRRAKDDGTRYSLIEWGWDRDACAAAISRAGLPQPGKSACFFCPSSRKSEVLALSKTHPELMARAIRMEANADLISIKGLGRRWSWRDLIASDAAQDKLFTEVAGEMPCGCYDGFEADGGGE